MAYSKTTWNTGDIITGQKLNNIENGIEASDNVVIAHVVYNITAQLENVITCEEYTAQELADFITNGKAVFLNVAIYNNNSFVVKQIISNAFMDNSSGIITFVGFNPYNSGNSTIPAQVYSANVANNEWNYSAFSISTSPIIG